MKRVILLLFLLLSPIVIFPQSSLDLPTCKAIFSWKSAINSLMFTKDILNIYDSSAERYTSLVVNDGSSIEHPQNFLYMEYKINVDAILKNIYYPIINVSPVCFATINEKDTCLIIGSYVFDKTFNTARTNDKDRAKTILSEMILPICSTLYDNLVNTDLKYIAIQVSYQKKNLIDSYDTGDICTLSSVFNLAVLNDFKELDISEDELIEKSSFYLYEDATLRKLRIE